MFRLTEKDTFLSNVNARTEAHGEEQVLALDLAFKITLPNTALDLFDNELRQMLFEKVDPDDMDLADQAMDHDGDYLPALRFPELGKVSWGYKGAGYRLTLHRGLLDDINLIGVDLDKFVFDPKQGGSVEVSFRAVVHPTEEEGGHLLGMIKSNVEITLTPPSAEERAQMEIDAAADEDEYDEDQAA